MSTKLSRFNDEEVMAVDDEFDTKNDLKNGGPALNGKNFMNLLFYLFNAVFTYGIGTAAWFGTTTNGDLSEKYQTLVTPDNIAFSIWGIVFLFQGIFAFVQFCSSSTRDADMVQDGVGYWYVLTCISQVGWSFAFGYNRIGVSVVLIFVILLSLAAIVYNQDYVIKLRRRNNSSSLLEFWLLRFPFEVHCGWVTVAACLNICVFAAKKNISASDQLMLAIVSLAILHLCSFWALFANKKPNFTIAVVITWGIGWIYYKLQTPSNDLKGRFNKQVLDGVCTAAAVVFILMLLQIVIRLLYVIIQSVLNRNEVEYSQELANTKFTIDDEEEPLGFYD